MASGVHTQKAAVKLSAFEIESVLLTKTSRWWFRITDARGVGLTDAHIVVPSDEVFMFWTYITVSHSTVDSDPAGTAESTIGSATKC